RPIIAKPAPLFQPRARPPAAGEPPRQGVLDHRSGSKRPAALFLARISGAAGARSPPPRKRLPGGAGRASLGAARRRGAARVASAIEAAKEELVERAETLAEAELAAARPFVAALYRHVPPEDVAARGPDALCAAALGLWRFGAVRRPGRALVRVFNPHEAGWTSPHTIVEIVNDDMPFLVDSVSQAIAESWMQIEISREPDAAARAALAERLAAVLADVRAAVGDWPAMRQTLRDIAAGLAAPVPPADIAEAAAFLAWLDAGNFTFLGFRDYPVAAGAAPARPPLGLLRAADYPVFGALHDIAALPPRARDFVLRREPVVVTKARRRATVHRNARMDAIGIRRFGPDGAVAGVGLFVGLLTSGAARSPVAATPLLRRKAAAILARAGVDPASHDGKALTHILDNLPRDELFQFDLDALYDTAIGILNLQ